MVPPPTQAPAPDWAELSPEEKRRRLLAVAAQVFAEEGLDASMPRVAEAAGIGVGSLYRCYGSKDDLVAAIVVAKMRELEAEVRAAAGEPDALAALEGTIRRLAGEQEKNGLVRAALAVTSERRDVMLARGEVSLAWQELIDRARGQGLRSDATVRDVRLIFAAARAADELEPAAHGRMLDLLLEAMRA